MVKNISLSSAILSCLWLPIFSMEKDFNVNKINASEYMEELDAQELSDTINAIDILLEKCKLILQEKQLIQNEANEKSDNKAILRGLNYTNKIILNRHFVDLNNKKVSQRKEIIRQELLLFSFIASISSNDVEKVDKDKVIGYLKSKKNEFKIHTVVKQKYGIKNLKKLENNSVPTATNNIVYNRRSVTNNTVINIQQQQSSVKSIEYHYTCCNIL
jgi:hypothetical protein